MDLVVFLVVLAAAGAFVAYKLGLLDEAKDAVDDVLDGDDGE